MDNTELLEQQLVDNNDDYSETDVVSTEDDTTSEESVDNGSEWKTTDDKTSKNTSNFKKLSKAYRNTQAELNKIKAEKEKYKKMIEKIDGGWFDDVEWNDEIEMRLYFIENPEAKQYKEEITTILEQYPNMNKEDALTLARAKTPKESQDINDFSLSSQVKSGKKSIKDLTEDEAVELDMDTFKQWKALQPKKSVWD